jgi:hypothetical protein
MKEIWVPLTEEETHEILNSESPPEEEIRACKKVELYRDEDPEELLKSLVESLSPLWILAEPATQKNPDKLFEGCYKCPYCFSEFQTRKEYKDPELHGYPCAWVDAYTYIESQKESKNE